MPDSEKKHHFWQVSPKMFEQRHNSGFFDRKIVVFLRSSARNSLYVLALLYPVYLVLVGLIFGGIAFWLFLLGSFAVVGILVSKLGYSRNFTSWGEFSFKRLGAFFLAFLITMGFYLGIIYLRGWFVIVAFPLLGVALVLFLVLRNRE